MADKKEPKVEKTEVKEEKVVKKTPKQETEDFIARKLKAINEMSSPAKARRAAERVLANRRKVGK